MGVQGERLTGKMEAFYKNWYEKNVKNKRQRGGADNVVPSTSAVNEVPTISAVPKQPSDIVYETNIFKLIVEKGNFKKQKNFRLQDHLFYFKIVPKQPDDQLPLLSDLYDFLHAALLYVLESIKTFYNPEDHNVAYLTLHQEPMVNGLNTGDFSTR